MKIEVGGLSMQMFADNGEGWFDSGKRNNDWVIP
jgi:hypothetical protein